jgi:hypothetical protein
MEDAFHIQCDDELFGEDWLQCHATRILDAKYENTNVRDVVDGLTECFEIEEESIQFNYLGPKILKQAPAGETPATILTANTIGLAKCRRLFRVLLDSGSTVCMIKRSKYSLCVTYVCLNLIKTDGLLNRNALYLIMTSAIMTLSLGPIS